ncbi:hypothetical protein GX50_02769 [[Emmonsia] crescens]|uniref:Uncharacterized protein n=1 Tax=[Emmonsia] crescens TaxID=73230 RepID=A0A2B7ZN26_9EURO|nr:hypothetical protein GX50_02769 [Emmonsia crescens]
MARDDAHFIFETAWKQFLQMGQEGVLISIAMGLAHSYVLSKRVNDTINFLEKICCGACPFGWLIQQPSKGIHDWRHFEELQRQKVATLYPALQQLANLYTEKSCDNGSILGILQSLQPHSEDILVDSILGYKYYRTGKQFQWYDNPLVARAGQPPHLVPFKAKFLKNKTRLRSLTMRRLCSVLQIGIAQTKYVE